MDHGVDDTASTSQRLSKHTTLRWIAVLPAALAGVLFGRLMAYGLSFAADLWPFSPAPLWLQRIDDLLVYFMCPACFITFGTHVAPFGHRAVSVLLAVAYFGFVAFAVSKFGGLGNTTVYGWLGLLVSLFSSISSIAPFYGRTETDKHDTSSC